MGRAARLLRNVAANWTGFAVNAIVTLVLTPFVLHTLGEARYGIWVISSSVVGYYGLLDLGFRGSTNQYLTRYLAVEDFARASATLSTAVVTLGCLGASFALLSVGAAYLAPLVWNIPAELASESFWCIVIVGLTASLQFVFFPFTSVFVATQRFDAANLIGVSTRLLTAAAVYLTLSRGYGLIGISAASCVVTLVDYLIRWRVARRLAPQLQVDRRLASRAQLRELAVFGVWTFLIAINSYVYLHAQPLLIGAFLPIAAVGHYALATGLIQQINGAISPIGQVIYPVATSLHAQSDRGTLLRLYHDGSRLMMLIMGCAVTIGFLWAEDFYRLWIGPRFVADGQALPSVASLFRLMLASTVIGFFSNVASQILMGSGRVPVIAKLLIIGSVINLSLSVALLPSHGLLGLAAAMVAASVVIDLIAIPLALQRLVGLRLVDMVRASCPRPLLVSALLAGACVALRGALPEPQRFTELLMHGLLAGTMAAALIATVGITRDERERFLFAPLRRLGYRS